MNENIKTFMQKVAADESLQAKMKAFTDMDEAYEFATSIQGGFTKEEFTDIMLKLSEKLNNDEELSDEDLASVAGGGGCSESEVITYAVSGGASIVAVSAIASSVAAA